MTSGFRRRLHRVCVITLLVLAVSPLTQPFSTYSFADLAATTTTLLGGFLQVKTAPDEGPSRAGGGLDVHVLVASTFQEPAPLPRDVQFHPAFHVPLRV